LCVEIGSHKDNHIPSTPYRLKKTGACCRPLSWQVGICFLPRDRPFLSLPNLHLGLEPASIPSLWW
ncbi:MAG: hypothetical protein LH647_01790, partial [Leptolyngbyaceae cyanobacterium CAN_BIN12]|nr:hypothetical protein [Leptolyngbyaceae cyanobacterium CAN_BIN12]